MTAIFIAVTYSKELQFYDTDNNITYGWNDTTSSFEYTDISQRTATDCNRDTSCKMMQCNTLNPYGNTKTIYCGNSDICIIQCTERMCLQNSIIHAENTASLYIKSSSMECITGSTIYLPDNGDVIIYATAPYSFSSNTLYSGSSTQSIDIICRSDYELHLCDDLYINASTAHHVDIAITYTSADGGYILCPNEANAECIINATHAISLQNATVIAPQSVTLYIGRDTDLTGSILHCDNAVMTYTPREYFYYGQCIPTPTTTHTPHIQYINTTELFILSSISDEYGNTNGSSSSDNDGMTNPISIMVGKVSDTGYRLIILMIAIPFVLVVIAAIYNCRFKGSDAPNFSSILKCFMNTTDLYTDIIFCVLLLFKLSFVLFIWCAGFIVLSHLISNIIGVYYIRKWRKSGVLYIRQYTFLVIMLSFIVGFYAAIQFLSSKLFYLMPFSMQLSNEQIYRIQILTISNAVLLRNIPLITIQVLSVLQNKMDILTTIAFASSLFMLITGSLTLFSRSISTKCRFKYHFIEDNMLMDIRIRSDAIRPHHQFCHRLFAECFALSLGIASDRVETLLITPTDDGICCSVEIVLIEDDDKVYRGIDDIQNNWDSTMDSFKIELCKALYVIEVDVDIVIVRDNRDSQSMQNQYKSLPQKAIEIEIVKVSTSLNAGGNTGGEDIELKYNEESESPSHS